MPLHRSSSGGGSVLVIVRGGLLATLKDDGVQFWGFLSFLTDIMLALRD